MSTILKLLGIMGVLLFGGLFSLTLVSPEIVENSAKGFVKTQIEKEVRGKRLAMSDASVTDAALKVAAKLGLEKEKIQADLDAKLPDKIASIIAAMCGYDCEKKRAVSESLASSYMDRIKNIQVAEATLNDVVKGKYLEIVGNLQLDLRIFLGSNLSMFLLLLVVSFLKPKAVAHLFLPSVLLVAATIISTGIYLYGQDWFYTILYNDYMGLGYLVYLAVIFGFLSDVIFNKGRVTSAIINALANMVGSVFSVVPC